MPLPTQKFSRVVITLGSQAVFIVYIQSKWLIVKNTRQLGSIYMHILYTVGGVGRMLSDINKAVGGLLLYIHMYIYLA